MQHETTNPMSLSQDGLAKITAREGLRRFYYNAGLTTAHMASVL